MRDCPFKCTDHTWDDLTDLGRAHFGVSYQMGDIPQRWAECPSETHKLHIWLWGRSWWQVPDELWVHVQWSGEIPIFCTHKGECLTGGECSVSVTALLGRERSHRARSNCYIRACVSGRKAPSVFIVSLAWQSKTVNSTETLGKFWIEGFDGLHGLKQFGACWWFQFDGLKTSIDASRWLLWEEPDKFKCLYSFHLLCFNKDMFALLKCKLDLLLCSSVCRRLHNPVAWVFQCVHSVTVDQGQIENECRDAMVLVFRRCQAWLSPHWLHLPFFASISQNAALSMCCFWVKCVWNHRFESSVHVLKVLTKRVSTSFYVPMHLRHVSNGLIIHTFVAPMVFFFSDFATATTTWCTRPASSGSWNLCWDCVPSNHSGAVSLQWEPVLHNALLNSFNSFIVLLRADHPELSPCQQNCTKEGHPEKLWIENVFLFVATSVTWSLFWALEILCGQDSTPKRVLTWERSFFRAFWFHRTKKPDLEPQFS